MSTVRKPMGNLRTASRARKLKRKSAKSRGQAMTEYIIIVALVAIGAIAVVTVFGDNLRALFGTSANALAGDDTKVEGQTVADDQTRRNLQNFNEFEAP